MSFALHSHDISTNFYNKEISILHMYYICTHFKLQNVLDEHNETASTENDIIILGEGKIIHTLI